MKNSPIGVFDSGLGGLTAVKELQKLLPFEDIIYFGDTSRVPYGTRSSDTIIRYATQDLNFLSTFGIKAALIACGTVSAVALGKVGDRYSFPVIGVIENTVREALESTKNGKIAIIGTNATIKSGAYERLIKERSPQTQTISVACPLFVPLVENGHIEKGDPITDAAVSHYLTRVKEFGADTVILGCTHYPIIAHAIGEFVGESTVLINSGKAAAKAMKRLLLDNNLISDRQTDGERRFFVSDSVEDFKNYGGIFMHRTITEEVRKIDIEKY